MTLTQCEQIIINDGNLNNIPEDIIMQAVEMFDKAVRRGNPIRRSMLDVVDMMHDVADEYA